VTPATARRTERPLRLALRALGGPQELAAKLARIGRTLLLWFDGDELARRMAALEARGFVSGRPSRAQLLFGGFDMLRFVITPAARDYYRQQGISFGFHQLLRVLDDPMSMVDPTGLLSDRDTIAGHLMQVVHLNPIYDLQLIQMFPDGLDDLERHVEQMVAGTHPRHRTIGAIVEEADYHARLLDYLRRYRQDPATPGLVRPQPELRRVPVFAAAERTFATLPGFLAYCRRLPRGPLALARRLLAVRRFPLQLAAEDGT
jgi:hypothetical protein